MMHKERQGDVGNLGKKTNFELKELLRRQEKILSNRSLLKNLPDRGAKLKSFVDKINYILEERGDVDSAARLLDTLSLDVQEKTVTGKEGIQKNNNGGPPTLDGQSMILDSNRFQTLHSNIFNKTGDEKNSPFRPFRTLNSKNIPANITKPEGYERPKQRTKQRELTSAYYLPMKKESVKSVDLSESLKLQQLQQEKVERLRAEQATEKLAERLGIKIGEFTVDVENAGSFREPESLNSDDEESGKDRVKNERELTEES